MWWAHLAVTQSGPPTRFPLQLKCRLNCTPLGIARSAWRQTTRVQELAPRLTLSGSSWNHSCRRPCSNSGWCALFVSSAQTADYLTATVSQHAGLRRTIHEPQCVGAGASPLLGVPLIRTASPGSLQRLLVDWSSAWVGLRQRQKNLTLPRFSSLARPRQEGQRMTEVTFISGAQLLTWSLMHSAHWQREKLEELPGFKQRANAEEKFLSIVWPAGAAKNGGIKTDVDSTKKLV